MLEKLIKQKRKEIIKVERSCVFLLFILLIGCTEPSIKYETQKTGDSSFIIKRLYNKNGSLLIEEMLNPDSINDGYFKEYENNKIKTSGSFINGKKDGSWLFLGAQNDTLKKENWFQGKQFGEQVDYYLKPLNTIDKTPVYKHSFYNLDGQKIFDSEFDLFGDEKKIKGVPMYYAYNKDSLLPEENFELLVFFSDASNLKTEITLQEKDAVNNRITFSETITNASKNVIRLEFANKYYKQKKYTKRGQYIWRLICRVNNRNNNTLIDTVSILPIYVK